MAQSKRKRGFVLVATAIGIVTLIGTLGLVVDLGRAYIVRNEAQAFTDAAAMAAALKLDNTSTGITAAKAAVAASVNRCYFGTKVFPSVVTEFSTNKTTWLVDPPSGAGYKFVRVSAKDPAMSVLFTRVVGSAATMTVGAVSTAGIQGLSSYGQGVFPFAPIAHSPVGPNFGYVLGDELTLLWPSSVQSTGNAQQMNNLCQSDRNPQALADVLAGITADRGYIQEASADAIAAAIEDDHMNYTVTLGYPVNRTGGVKVTDVYQSLEDRVNQDSSPNVPTYDGYISGHDSSPMRRIVLVPIIGDAVNAIVVGYAKVFLPPNQAHNPNKSKCATYIGPADTATGNNLTGDSLVRLLQ